MKPIEDYIHVNKACIVPDERIGFSGFVTTRSENGAKFKDNGFAILQLSLLPAEDGFSYVQCGNGNICGRNTSGPGVCCE